MELDQQALDKTLASLREVDYGDVGVQVALQRVVNTMDSLFGVSGTGLMFVDDADALRYVAASDEPGRVLEVAQEETGIGPCVDALIYDSVIRSVDLANDPRYEAMAPMVTKHGVRSVLGVPVHIGGTAVGSLNAYADEPHAWTDTDTEAIAAFGKIIEMILANAILSHRQSAIVEQLEFALQNRVVIERAVGVVMGRDAVGPVAAFNKLRNQARSERRKVAVVAQEVLDAVVDRVPAAE
jgi:GAF domain-containing protein